MTSHDIETINKKIEEIGIDRLTIDYINKDLELQKHPEVREIIDEIGNRKEFDAQKMTNEKEQEYLDRLDQITHKRCEAFNQEMMHKLRFQDAVKESDRFQGVNEFQELQAIENFVSDNDDEISSENTQPITPRPRTTLLSRFVSIFTSDQSISDEELPSPIVPPRQSLLQRLMGNNNSERK